MIRIDNRSSLVAIVVNLHLGYIQTKLYCNIDAIDIAFKNIVYVIFDIDFIWNRRNVRRAADSNWYASYSSSFLIETFVYEFCNVRGKIIIARGFNNIFIEDEFLCVF